MVERLNELAQQKQTLIRLYDGNEIDRETYTKEMAAIEAEMEMLIAQKSDILIDLCVTNENEKEQQRIQKKEQQESIVKKEEKKRGTKSHKNSNNNLIIKALMDENIKDIDEVVDQVKKWKPELDSNKVLLQTRTVISMVKHQRGYKWNDYKWDEEQFLLKEK